MKLFERIKQKSIEKKLDNLLNNELYNVLDSFVETKGKVKKGLLPREEAVKFLTAVCDQARKIMKFVKEQNEEIFLKYENKFELQFGFVDNYIDQISSSLNV